MKLNIFISSILMLFSSWAIAMAAPMPEVNNSQVVVTPQIPIVIPSQAPVAVAPGMQIRGYNNSRIMDQLTDSKGVIIESYLEQLALIPKSSLGLMRFPGGTLARKYDIDKPGYGDTATGGKYKVNVIDDYIKVVKRLNVPVVLVLSVGKYDTFFWNIDVSQEAAYLDKNKRMIQKFMNAGIKILAVELGNEEMFHIPKGNFNQNATYRAEVIKYYKMYAEIYKKNSALVKSFGLKAAVPMLGVGDARGREWNSIIASVPAEYGNFHIYESGPENTWQTNVDRFVVGIKAQGRIPISTEWSVWFGDWGDLNPELAVSDYRNKFESWFRNYTSQAGVAMILQHRINGNPSTWTSSTSSYDLKTW